MLLIVIATGFNTFLSTLAFKTIYVNSIISQYNVIGGVLKKKIELSLSFGKKIDNFFGMDALMESNLTYLNHVNSIQPARSDVQLLITTPQGKILYTTEKTGQSLEIVLDTRGSLTHTPVFSRDSKNFFTKDHHYFIVFPINNWDKSLAAIQVISFPEKLILDYLGLIIKKSLFTWCWVLMLSFVLLFFTFYLGLRHARNQADSLSTLLKTKGFSHCIFGIIVLCQILFSASQIHNFSRHYLTLNQDKADVINQFMKNQLEGLVKKGIDLKQMNQAERSIHNMIKDIPEFSDIMITDPQGQVLYHADQTSGTNYRSPGMRKLDVTKSPQYVRTKPLMDKDQRIGAISLLISETVLTIFLRKIFLDSATTIVISIFFCVEIMILFFIGFRKKQHTPSGKSHISTRIIRPIAFVYFFAIDIVVSFVPLYMKNLNSNASGFFLFRDISLGLPITVQMIFSAISILIVGAWCDRKGWQQPFLIGVIFSALGFLAAGISNAPVLFIIALAIAGFGYGLSYIAGQNFVTTNSPPEHKAQGLSEYYAGCIAGSLCGIVTGGMLAEQIGFAQVFLVGSGILICLFVWVFFFLKSHLPNSRKTALSKTQEKPVSLTAFLGNKKIACLIFLNIVPASVLIVGFLNYFVPIYLQKNNISQSDIGRIFMLYGICLIYLAPFITRRINALKHSIAAITTGGILCSMTLLTFFFTSGYRAVVISILFLGLGASFNALRNAYALNLTISKQFGEGRATSLIFFLARLGQALGPMAFVWATVSGSTTQGVVRLGGFFLFLSIGFLLLTHFSNKDIPL
ncbi:MAG: MFS transporter [Proteobacteria bacterium]|nr:MFS transporter [Pseudomonadota bacterium]